MKEAKKAGEPAEKSVEQEVEKKTAEVVVENTQSSHVIAKPKIPENKSLIEEGVDLASLADAGVDISLFDIEDTEADDPKDILLPSLVLCQDLSRTFTKAGAKPGDFVCSNTHKTVANLGEPLEFIPVFRKKAYDVNVQPTQKGENATWLRTEEYIEGEEPLCWENFEEDGKILERFETMTFFVMLPKLMEEGNYIPYKIKFKRSSYKAGKMLYTLFKSVRLAGSHWGRTVFTMTSIEETNKNNQTYYVPKIERKRNAKVDELLISSPWMRRKDELDQAVAATDERDRELEEGETIDHQPRQETPGMAAKRRSMERGPSGAPQPGSSSNPF